MIVRKNEWTKTLRHLEVMNHEMGDVRDEIRCVSQDVDWLKKLIWVSVVANMSTNVLALMSLFGVL